MEREDADWLANRKNANCVIEWLLDCYSSSTTTPTASCQTAISIKLPCKKSCTLTCHCDFPIGKNKTTCRKFAHVTQLLEHGARQFWDYFWRHSGTILGLDWPKIEARWDQESHRELQRPKFLHLAEKLKIICVLPCFWGPGPSQESFRKPGKAPKRHPKILKTSKK